ncbi:MAG TPA: C25 family cysteine peptidase [Pyrinomonadaceae bacterium]|nr:C25 family cysteine peptidase [Pyrinomonadaceae bacterium]
MSRRDAPANAVYYVESVDVSSERDMSPAIPTQLGTAKTAKTNSPLVSELNYASNNEMTEVEPKFEPAAPKEVENAAQSAISSLGGAKVLVRRAGYYRVTAAELFANGVPTNVEPQNLRLFMRGVEQAMTVDDKGDGRLDPTDTIEFYGIPASTNETESNVYYVAASQQQGRRIEFGNFAGQPSDATTFISTVERRDRNVYISSLLNGEEPNYFGSIVNQSGVDQQMNIIDAVPTGTANVRVILQGIARSEHLVRVELNGSSIGTIDFAQFMRGEGNFSVPASAITSGVNNIRLVSMVGPTDVSVVDRIQISYPRKLRASDGRLRFTANAGQAVTVGGFASKGVRIFDITDAAAPIELSTRMLREAITPDSLTRTFTATATPEGSGTRQMLAILDRFESANVVENTPSNLGAITEGDLVILTNSELRPSVEPLAARRRSQGLKVAVVDVADIYDEYNFGLKSSQSIRQFLQTAFSTWIVRPSYLLLAGDASSDQNEFTGTTDKLQTRLVDTPSMETASDEWFADFDNDGTAEIAIGRLPAANAGQMETLIRKTLSYEQQAVSNSATFVSDLADGFDFAAVSQIGRNEMPSGTTFVNLDRDGTNDAELRSDLLSAFSSGQRIVSYIGHGTTGLWRGNIFTRNDAEALSNNGRLPVVISMTCMNGYNHNPYGLSLSESLLLNQNGGAAAVWASTGTTLPDSYGAITRELHRSMVSGATLGQAHRQAKSAITNYEVRQTWTLFGDPSMTLR